MKWFKSLLSIILISIILLYAFNTTNSQTKPEEILKKAIQLSNSNRHQEALDLLETIKNDINLRKEVFFVRGVIFQKQQKWNDAISSLKETVKIDKNHLKAHYHLAMLYEKQNKKSQAITEWKNVLRLAKNKSMKKTAEKHIKVLSNK